MRYRCYRCGSHPNWLEWEGDPQCPRCGTINQRTVIRLADVHLIVADPKGPIMGMHDRQYIACQPKRDYLAVGPQDTFSATPDPRVVSCPSCKGTPEFKELAKLFPEIHEREFLRKQLGLTIDGSGCC